MRRRYWPPSESPLSLFLCRYRYATMLGAGDDGQSKFARESNFGCVIAVKRDALEHREEIASQLCIPFGDGVAVTCGARRTHGNGFIQRAHQRELLRGASIYKILGEKFVALLVHAGETFQKMAAVIFRGPLGENHVDEFVDARTFRAGRVGFRDDDFAHENDSGVLVRIKRAQRIARRGMRVLKKGKELGGKSRGNRTRREKFQRITPLHRTSVNRLLWTDHPSRISLRTFFRT